MVSVFVNPVVSRRGLLPESPTEIGVKIDLSAG